METLCNAPKVFLNTYIKNLKYSLDALDLERVDRIVAILLSAFLDDKQVFIMGNGGSASTASHFACDLSNGTGRKRLRAVSLNDNSALITALSNDIGYDEVFREQLENLLNRGDVVIAITASGNSSNILRAVDYARTKGATSIGLTGFEGGKLSPLVDERIVIDSSDYGCIEDVHLILAHMIAQSFKNQLAGEHL